MFAHASGLRARTAICPTRAEGPKVIDHHVNSPLLKVNRSCQRTCHHFSEEELKQRLEDIQDRFFDLRNTALDVLVDLINDVNANKDKVNPEQLATLRDYQRRGQVRIDFTMSGNSMGFHPPQEAVRVLGAAIKLCHKGQIALHGARHRAISCRTYKRCLRLLA